MATPITASTFRSIVENSLNKVFDEVYGEKSFENEYMIEVNFDEQDEIQVRNSRGDDVA
jgi:hypothetical protein